MSLIPYPNPSRSKMSGGPPIKSKTRAVFATQPIASRLRKTLAAGGRVLLNLHRAIAEARSQRAMIEAELYSDRYVHTSKNDDDLPIVRHL